MDIIKKVKSLNLPLGQYAVFGSGPMSIRGIRESHDIDLVITTQLYEKLKSLGWKEVISNNGSPVLHDDGLEAADSWNFGEYNPDVNELIGNSELIRGIPFIKLEEVI